jgi:UDP-glucose 4-epimerase
VIFSSSAAVYGDSPELPKREDMLPEPKSPYAAAKLAGEYYCRVFQEIYGIKTTVLRYFNVFGPRQDPNSEYAAVIPKFITSILSGKNPIIFGDGEQTRDFVYVADVVKANILASSSHVTGIFNIASGKSTSLNGLIRILVDITGKEVKPVYKEARSGDIRHSLARIENAGNIEYTPDYSRSRP